MILNFYDYNYTLKIFLTETMERIHVWMELQIVSL
jgi:hypothetical protein